MCVVRDHRVPILKYDFVPVASKGPLSTGYAVIAFDACLRCAAENVRLLGIKNITYRAHGDRITCLPPRMSSFVLARMQKYGITVMTATPRPRSASARRRATVGSSGVLPLFLASGSDVLPRAPAALTRR